MYKCEKGRYSDKDKSDKLVETIIPRETNKKSNLAIYVYFCNHSGDCNTKRKFSFLSQLQTYGMCMIICFIFITKQLRLCGYLPTH